jgi:hypothetical protein
MNSSDGSCFIRYKTLELRSRVLYLIKALLHERFLVHQHGKCFIFLKYNTIAIIGLEHLHVPTVYILKYFGYTPKE